MTYVEMIQKAIDKAKCIVVLWSKKSIKSEYVIEEATIGKRRKILVPAKIDQIEPPIGFSLIQAADLTDWKAGTIHAGFENLLSAISDLVARSPSKCTIERDTEDVESNTEKYLNVQPEDRKPSLLRRMLLLYLPRSRKGWILHVPFYSIFGFMILLWFVVLMAVVINKYDQPPRFDIPMLTFLFISIPALILLVLLQRFASKVHHIESEEE
jgi:hypothetical protein